MVEYRVGRDNMSATIFIPVDCGNNCPFCTTKQLYLKHADKFNIKEIINKIKLLNKNPYIKEFVITGGEPLANLDILKQIIDAAQRRCFINTTMPRNIDFHNVIDYINSEDKIEGISVSRHPSSCLYNDTIIKQDIIYLPLIKKHVRINMVLSNGFDSHIENFFASKAYSELYSKFSINLRADYRKITDYTLKNRDEVTNKLYMRYNPLGANGCLVCYSEAYEDKKFGNIISYHRGLEHSHVVMQDGDNILEIVNDCIIMFDGTVYKDWDFISDKEFDNYILGLDGRYDKNLIISEEEIEKLIQERLNN